ncbi:MAG: hypothetical protein JSV03_03190 [Planctomycetota bacterium]|nr:MAG: hypothetical protein JSV03_03190 [Planctomycetota bacterium]
MSEEATGSSNSKPKPGDIDLYCLQCGYNLRGHTGDPRRCPECGHLNHMGDLELPAKLISKQLQRMETAPTVCVGAIIIMILLCIPIILAWLDAKRQESSIDDSWACCCMPQLGLVIVWLLGLSSFQSSCLNKPGWRRLLFKYHLYGILSSSLILLILFGVLYAGYWIDKTIFSANKGYLIIIFLIIDVTLVILTIFKLGGWARCKIKKDLDILQREVAVKIARDRLQKELRRKPKW